MPTNPTNLTAATAIDVSTLPYSGTFKSTVLAGANPSLWFVYTPQSTDVVLGTWAFTSLASANKPTVRSWFGTAVSLTRLNTLVDLNETATNVPYSIPMAAGTSTLYFFEVRNAGVDVAGVADLSFSAVVQPALTTAVGDLMVNDETFGFPVATCDPATGAVKQLQVFSAGESVDIQPDGTMLAEAIDFNGNAIGLQIWNADFTLDQTIAYPWSFGFGDVSHIYTSPLGGWWISARDTLTTTTVVKMFVDGTFGASYTVTNSSSANSVGIAVNNDETILYYAITGSAGKAVQRWDLVNDVALADFAAGIANYNVNQDLLVLSDNTVIVGYFKPTTTRDSNVLHYSAAGALLDTYAFGGSFFTNRLCRALDNPTSFWVWLYPGGATTGVRTGANRYVNVTVSGGALAQDFTVAQYERGVYSTAATATPTARFGPSFSCPMWIYQSETPVPPDEPVEYLIRRERWWPHISSEQFRQFFSMLQVDLFAGNGITTGQGEDPLLEVDWSDDGGHTWSSIHFVHTGKIGAYRQRAILRRMGYSRDRVYRIAVSDPNQWVIVNGYLQAVLGTS